MKHRLIRNIDGNERLILFFAGWGMDYNHFLTLSVPEGYDLMVVWDYNDDRFDADALSRYSEIVLVGWSMGVYMGARFASANPNLPFTLCIAVAGTLSPVSDTHGIPEAVFQATLDSLSERSLEKFNLRMCGSKSRLEAFVRPKRSIEDLRSELARIAQVYRSEGDVPPIYEKAVITLSDRIFPPENQRRSFPGKTIFEIEEPHLPDFRKIIERLVIDKQRVRRRFNKSVCGGYDANAQVQKRVCDKLLSMIPDTVSTENVLEIGSGTGQLTERFLKRFSHPGTMTLIDLLPTETSPFFGHEGFKVLSGDAETVTRNFDNDSVDLLISASTMQWFNSPSRFLENVARILRKGGVAAISTFSPRTFHQLKDLTNLLPLPDLDSLKGMIPHSLEILAFESEELVRIFDSPLDVLFHMRSTGVNSLMNGQNAGSAALRIVRHYPLNPDKTASLTYSPVYIILKKK